MGVRTATLPGTQPVRKHLLLAVRLHLITFTYRAFFEKIEGLKCRYSPGNTVIFHHGAVAGLFVPTCLAAAAPAHVALAQKRD